MSNKVKPSPRDIYACRLLMEACDVVDPTIFQFWITHVKECLDHFDLPTMICAHCNETVFTFFNYYLQQGMCYKCAKKQPHQLQSIVSKEIYDFIQDITINKKPIMCIKNDYIIEFKCVYCTKTFDTFSKYKSHLNIIHPWEMKNINLKNTSQP